MRLFKRERHDRPDDHEEVAAKLKEQEEQLADHARRLRALEAEVGIYKPPVLKEVNGS